MSEHTCCARVIPRDRYGSFNPHTCGKPATVEANGRHYCNIHSPEAVQKRNERGADRRARNLKAKEDYATARLQDALVQQGLVDQNDAQFVRAFTLGWNAARKIAFLLSR